MFERFTERARFAVVEAQQEARAFKHNYIGTEHLLLGLLRGEEGLAAEVLAALDVTIDAARVRVATIVGEGDEAPSGQIPFTPRAKKVLELALREGLSLGDNYIGTEHLLLGLVREGDGIGARILLDFGADPDKVSAMVLSAPGRSGKFPAAALPPMSENLRVALASALDSVIKAKKTAKTDKDSKRVAMIVYAERLLAALLDEEDEGEKDKGE